MFKKADEIGDKRIDAGGARNVENAKQGKAMKTKFVTIVAALAAMASTAQTNQVLSRNAVGYEQVMVPTGKLVLVRCDFVNLAGAPYTVTNLIGDQLPSGSTVLLWDKANAQYIAEGKTRSGWGPGTNIINRGDGFFIRGPTVATTNQYAVYLMGEVPDATSAGTTTVNNVTGIGMYGYPYPVAVAWTNTTLAINAASGDNLLTWDTANQQYIAYGKTRSGWGPATNLVLQPGQGFWFRNVTSTQTWSEAKPYTWP